MSYFARQTLASGPPGLLVAAFRGLLAVYDVVTRPAIYTIGQGKRQIDDLVAALRVRDIGFLCDVRSVPISNHAPPFCRDELRGVLAQHGITYVPLGEALGGRPSEPSLYRDGFVDYDRLMAWPSFQDGIDRVVRGALGGHVLAIFCSEGSPEKCHRSKAVGRSLETRGVRVVHIDSDDRDVEQDVVLARLAMQPPLLNDGFDPRFVSRRRYR